MMTQEYNGFNIASAMGRFKEIKCVGRGGIPDALKGLYTSVVEAEKAIDTYLLLNPRVTKNVASEGTS